MILIEHIALAVLFCGGVNSIETDRPANSINSHCREAHSFECGNKKCVPVSKRCDGRNDCGDNSDEERCSKGPCEPPHWFHCKTKMCISNVFRCDGYNDCGDYSDEQNCDTLEKLTMNTTCADGEWKCNDNLCIPVEWVCNGQSDCLDNSDETTGCKANTSCFGFRCRNGRCLTSLARCDGIDDCGDLSDEVACNVLPFVEPEDCTIDERKFLCSDNVSCVYLSKACDGTYDCPDKSDEAAVCSVKNTCDQHNCTHDCVMLPSGPTCICPRGYRTVNVRDCEDVDECERYGICDQKCANTIGSYTCYCDDSYALQSDNKTCKSRNGEGLMVFSSTTEIRAMFLDTRVYFQVANNLKQVIGVDYNGEHVYWTDIFSESESIVRSLEDGSNKELIVTAGLSAPEDLAIDWITGNIYFTDAEMKHIGVCTSDGDHCTVLVNNDIDKPRAIALNPAVGEMYWTDWGSRPEIARSRMDGTEDTSFVSTDIHWPNGLAIDYHNGRLYWTDAKHTTLESIRLDGTDRRVVLEGIVKHPYAIAVFENRLYWSDWVTRSIQSCDKFTCKNRETLVKDEEHIYGLRIHHSSIKQKVPNPCATAYCSDICLLSGSSYTCACPQNKVLTSDRHTCKEENKQEYLIVATKQLLTVVQHQLLGKHNIYVLPTTAKEIGAIAYDAQNNSLIIFDSQEKTFLSTNLVTKITSVMLHVPNAGEIPSFQFDYFGQNLYWCDSTKGTVEVYSFVSNSKTVLLHELGEEKPTSIVLVPPEGLMFIAFEKNIYSVHIDRMHMDGSGRTHVIEQGLMGPVKLAYDSQLYRILWADGATGNIESTSIEGDDRHGFRSLQALPVDVAAVTGFTFWCVMNSAKLFWADKLNIDTTNRKLTLDIPEHSQIKHLLAVVPEEIKSHPCQNNNGNCSHICLASGKDFTCACPLGLKLKSNGRTCFKPANCGSEEFLCAKSQTCLPLSMKCNGMKDCPEGEDEVGCKPKVVCEAGHFQCQDGECIKEEMACDYHYDCKDKSDEQNCTYSRKASKCPESHFKCSEAGNCISNTYLCDGTRDCSDGSDEENCKASVCAKNQFRCTSGTCIPKNWECDGNYDCVDLSDEHEDCKRTVTCSPDKFRCDNGFCIDKVFRCNGMDDCSDSSDELHCQVKLPENNCRPNEFSCTKNPTVCVHKDAVCNGTSECPHHEDEQGCSNCRMNEFTCDNKKCIELEWVCDKMNDCGDGSDEQPDFCLHHVAPMEPTFHGTCEGGFRCKSGHCIDMSLVCNKKEDCYDGSDENGACTELCKKGNPCSQVCHETPSGPTCSCRQGYRLGGDGHSCFDVKECSMEPPLCSQKCIETEGSFLCDCYEGFILRTDRVSCRSLGNHMDLVVSTANEIHLYSQQEKSLSVLYNEESPKITGLDVSSKLGHIYFCIQELGTIYRINTMNSKREFMSYVGYPKTLSVDWITQNVYYVDTSTGSMSLRVCNFEHQKCSLILHLHSHTDVSALAVDPINKYLFYAKVHWFIYNAPTSSIFRCNLDGTKSFEVVQSTKGHITGLTYDPNKKFLYFANQHEQGIFRVGYDGKNQMNIAKNTTRGLSLFEDHLYFLLPNGYMGKCKLYGKEITCESFRLNAYHSSLFAISQPSRQPEIPNICASHNCSHLCIPSDIGVRCLCETSDVVGEGEECRGSTIKEHLSSENRKPKFFSVPDNIQMIAMKSHSSGSLVAGILAPLFIIILAVMVYYFMKKKNSGKFNVSVRFQNPVYGILSQSQERVMRGGHHEYTNPVFTKKNEERNEDLVKMDD